MDPQDQNNTGGQDPMGGQGDQSVPAGPADQGNAPVGGDSMPPAEAPTPEPAPEPGAAPEMAPPPPTTEETPGDGGQPAA